MRVAINGMGRIGRLLCRRLLQDPELSVIAVNDIMDIDHLCYLLKYDSLYGSYATPLHIQDDRIVAGNKSFRVLQQAEPSSLPWKELDIDVVIECSGRFTSGEKAAGHLHAGAGKVLLSTTGSEDIPLIIYGFNHHKFTNDITMVSPGGCMTNCATHVLYILNSIGIESAHIHMLHSYTSRQSLVDTSHSQYRRGRAAAESIIPVEIDLAQSLERLLPPLAGKIATSSTRVPVTNGAMGDFVIRMKEPVTRTQINALFHKTAEMEYKGIIAYTDDPLVSADIKGNTHSLVLDGTLTAVAGKQVRLVAWFDNEYGYTSRIIDWLHYMKKAG
ncbi:MAG: type I glyceraldehyde-3-phosphate dehydrogenase [Chitinophagaceae bacterium]|nr:type I glyceraldehyde-3-phosphate dehydrogenase [Chitinophagaceae bacterium]